MNPQHSLPAAYYRGGTSRAIFFDQKDLPRDREQWNAIFLGSIGSPDPYGRQLDGLGGGISSLSKICVVGESTRPDADVDYTFVSIGVKDSAVDYSSNCGNMSSAVGPFAVDSQLFPVSFQNSGIVTVRIHNTNTGKIIKSTFPVVDGEAAASGEFAIDGVAGTAALVQLEFINPAGSRTGKLFPTGKTIDIFDGIEATCVDAANPCTFVRSVDLGVAGDISPDEISAHPNLLQRLDSIRRQAGVRMGLAQSREMVPPSVPKICLVSSPISNTRALQTQAADNPDILVRAVSVGQPHKAVPITAALALASAAKTETSTVASVMNKEQASNAGITLGHASGNLLVDADFGDGDGLLKSATVFRTARRLFEGRVFWKNIET
ncbi:unnamed protein product [Penicillium salamii]|uniref:PrpF protein n=1 Tax=Penicillium salamii TaxID=1612424 RepID=A0A9W4NCU1_9EURO|nr:unnamed protein product [Penicillium salamii]CAG8118409.1 unnamed protein product [Penicillium salamii]CAG8294167.1 unnamed protein product [Penicillium salamii]CAG8345513.1 unnamed protein product [Penicillium salamii]CAG8347522.1 unnamed protein product [Penicillium salamii]